MAGEGVHRYQLISVISPASLPSSQPPTAGPEGRTRESQRRAQPQSPGKKARLRVSAASSRAEARHIVGTFIV